MGEAQPVLPAQGQPVRAQAMPTADGRGRRRPRAPAVAAGLGVAGLALTAAWVPLIVLTRDPQASRDGIAPVFVVAAGLLGLLVARRQPRNPEGWLLLGGGFSSPVAVAASTLAAAALFASVRGRFQRAVDRRFNRARYDAERTVAAFAERLRVAVDLDTARAELAGAVQLALAPAHVSVWVSRRD